MVPVNRRHHFETNHFESSKRITYRTINVMSSSEACLLCFMPFKARREATEAFYRVDFQSASARETSTERLTEIEPGTTLLHFTRLLDVCGLLFSVPKGERLETENRAAGKGDRLQSISELLFWALLTQVVLKLKHPCETHVLPVWRASRNLVKVSSWRGRRFLVYCDFCMEKGA